MCMNKKILIIVILAVALLGTGFVVYRVIADNTRPLPQSETEQGEAVLPEVDESVKVTVGWSTSESNTVTVSVTGMESKMVSLGYELTYVSEGLIKGVNSGSKPLDVSGKDAFDRDIYLGTCSRNVCKPDTGVTDVSIALEFTDTSGQKFQFTEDYTLE
jgi:hypothetical protein